MHPRSKQWHLLDYIIVKASQVREVYSTRTMRGAECWTDHRLIMSKMNLKICPMTPRRNGTQNKKINCAALQDALSQREYALAVDAILQELNETQQNMSAEESWELFSKKLLVKATEVLGIECKNHRDWFNENCSDIQSLLEQKNRAYTAYLNIGTILPQCSSTENY